MGLRAKSEIVPTACNLYRQWLVKRQALKAKILCLGAKANKSKPNSQITLRLSQAIMCRKLLLSPFNTYIPMKVQADSSSVMITLQDPPIMK